MKKNILLSSAFLLNFTFFIIFIFTKNFPWILILTNLLTILILWLCVVDFKKIIQLVESHRLDVLLLFILLLISFFIRIYKVDEITPGMWGDEVTIALAGEKTLSSKEFTPFLNVNYGHATPPLYLEGISTSLLGKTITSVRLPSIIFGVADILIFYIFLRLFFKKILSFITSLIVVFSYSHIIISRLAYETTISMFFQIFSLVFLYLFYKTNKLKYLLGAGLSIGAGFYTYLGFRTFAVAFIVLVLVFLFLRKDNLINKAKIFLLFISIFFISAVPILSFSLIHPDQILARTKVISVFSQNLSGKEIVKEIGGSFINLSYMFVSNGDPNPRQNPSGVSTFDIVTVVLIVLGLISLYKVNKKIFVASLFLCMPFVLNDILSLEIIPEAHYYGLGHPNTLRVSGLIPILYFWFTFGLYTAGSYLKNISNQFYQISVCFFVSLIIILNLYFYFAQTSINPNFYVYNYEVNQARTLNVVKVINSVGTKKINISPSFGKDQRVVYFSRRDAILNDFNPSSEEDAISKIRSNDLTIFDARQNKTIAEALTNDKDKYNNAYNTSFITNPVGGVEAIVFTKIK